MMMLKGTGWIKDPYSDKDYTAEHPAVLPLTEKLKLVDPTRLTLPRAADLRAGFLPVTDQGQTNGCSGCAGVALFEYSMWHTSQKFAKCSSMFVYKVARNFMRAAGDSGAYLRMNMKVLSVVGVCPEEFWPYNPLYVDVEPPAFCYAIANNFEALKYYKLDITPRTTEDLLLTVKAHLAAKVPAMFGVLLPQSVTQYAIGGMIPHPSPWDPPRYAHAMVAVGYDDDLETLNTAPQPGFSTKSRGALLVRNSWGPSWGQMGYGWLPYEYVLSALTGDWWCLISSKWVDLDVFEGDPARPPIGAGP